MLVLLSINPLLLSVSALRCDVQLCEFRGMNREWDQNLDKEIVILRSFIFQCRFKKWKFLAHAYKKICRFVFFFFFICGICVS